MRGRAEINKTNIYEQKFNNIPFLLDEKELSKLLNFSLEKTREIMKSNVFPTENINGLLLVSIDNLIKWLTYNSLCDKYIELNYKERTEKDKKLIRTAFYKGVQEGINSRKKWELNRKEVG